MTTTINASTTLGLQQTADTSGILQLQTASTAALTIDASQNVGIGTSSPVSKLHAYGSGQIGTIESSGNYATSGAGYVRWKDVNGNAAFVGFGGNANNFDIYNSLAGALTFHTNATERARIDSSGSFRIYANNPIIAGTSSAANASSANAIFQGRYSATSTTGGGTDCIFITSNGNLYNTNGSYGTLSDVKLKENIVDATSQWNDIKALRVRNFNFKEGQTHTQIGYIAQEVEEVSPSLVDTSPDIDADGNELGTTTKSLKLSVINIKAVKALQENMIRTEALETLIQEQQALITTLTERVAALENK